jgi:hypothetical protein
MKKQKNISESLKKYHSENIKAVNNIIIERDNKLGKKLNNMICITIY